MKRVIFGFAAVVMAVSFFSCSKPVDFYDIRVLEKSDGAAYGKAYKKLSKQQKVEYWDFRENLTSEDFYNHIVETRQDLFPVFNTIMGEFLENERIRDEEIDARVLAYQNKMLEIQGRLGASVHRGEYNSVSRDYSYYLFEIGRRNEKAIAESLEEKTNEKMNAIEKERLIYEITKIIQERKNKLGAESTAFREEQNRMLDLAREEAERRRQEQIAIAQKKAEAIRIEKERRGGVAESFSLNDLSTNRWVGFYLMNDGSGIFDYDFFDVDSYINAENIKGVRIMGVINPGIQINGKRYVVVR